jgi:hypothetical protein
MANPSDSDPRTGPPGPSSSGDRHHHRGGIGFPVFLVLAGLALLAERVGWLPNGFDWLFPVVLIAWGLSEFYERFSSR